MKKGDININKKVDVSDIVIMNKYLVKLEKFSEQQFFFFWQILMMTER